MNDFDVEEGAEMSHNTQPSQSWTERFDRALHTTMQHLGPQFILHTKTGLTPGQFFMLYFIEKEGLCTASRLAEVFEVKPSAITVMLDRLEAHGFVVRKRDQHDRRVVLIELTEKGNATLHYVIQLRNQVLEHCFQQLEPTEIESVVCTLEKLADISSATDLKSLLESLPTESTER
jgi:MarR family transcriptional regulator, organic hydroperoxide resistance regulator